MPAWVNYRAFKMLKKKPLLISTFHGLYSFPIYSKVMSFVDHSIAISKTVERYILENYRIEKDDITVIPRGCDPIEFNNDVINPNVIIQPKSITGLIPLKIKDKNAQIVVKAVYIIGKNIFCVVLSKILIFFSFANSVLICKNLVLI